MNLIRLSVFLYALLFSLVALTQQKEIEEVMEVKFDLERDTSDLDSAAAARRQAYEQQIKRLNEYERLRKKDPKRFVDSLRALSRQKHYEEALVRLSTYETLGNFSALKEVDLSGARLERLPDFVFEAENMEVLILDDNNITELPEKLSELKNLKRIYWRNCDLGNRKVKIPKLEGIEKLDLSGNTLEKLPKAHRMKGIEKLVLNQNDFKTIPLWQIRKFKTLKELEMSRNPLTLERRWYWLLNDLSILKLNKCELSELHPSLYKMKSLEELQLQENKLDSLPEGISRLKRLTKVSFYKNSLDKLPADFFELKNLKLIDLYHNELQIIPKEIARLDSIKVLYLSFNQLYDIPEEVGKLSSLEELYIHHNRISEIPWSFGDLQRLRVLHFQHNYVPQFPTQILSMKSLKDLDISSTEIDTLPLALEGMGLEAFFWKEVAVDLKDPENEAIVEMIRRMTASGMTISPRIHRDDEG